MLTERLVLLAGLAHLASLSAILVAPRQVGWTQELARLPKLVRQMCNVYSGYTSGTIVAMGLVSVLLPGELTSGTPLARAVCGYIAAFWAVRLWLQIAYDARPVDKEPGWGRESIPQIDLANSLELALYALREYRDDKNSSYVDGHAWVFTPASFELLILELAAKTPQRSDACLNDDRKFQHFYIQVSL